MRLIRPSRKIHTGDPPVSLSNFMEVEIPTEKSKRDKSEKFNRTDQFLLLTYPPAQSVEEHDIDDTL